SLRFAPALRVPDRSKGIFGSAFERSRRRGGVVTQRSAKPRTPVQFRPTPPSPLCHAAKHARLKALALGGLSSLTDLATGPEAPRARSQIRRMNPSPVVR